MGATKKIVIPILTLLILIAIGFGWYEVTHHTTKAIAKTGCTTEQLSEGSSGSCVSDIQTMVNYMETAGLNECAFPNAKLLTVNGTYDNATRQQVQSVQSWYQCYTSQEDSQTNVTASGTVDPATWHFFCSYAYQFPSQSSSNTSPFRLASIAAGKKAGC